MMYSLEVREREIFVALKKLKNFEFVVIGGYAVNVYALPRFSIDCDIVVKDSKESLRVEKVLKDLGYSKEEESKVKTPYHGKFIRYEKNIENGFKVSFDVLIGKVLDRQTGAVFSSEWVFKNSIEKDLKGKVAVGKIKVKVPTVEALTVMKLLSCRNTDIRDIFMMVDKITNLHFVQNEVNERVSFSKQFKKLEDKIISKTFKNNLQGVFGFVQESVFNKNKKLIFNLGEYLTKED